MNPLLTLKPLRRIPFANLPGITQKEAIYLCGVSAGLIGVILTILIGVPLSLLGYFVWFDHWFTSGCFAVAVLLASFVLGYVLGSYTGTLIVFELSRKFLKSQNMDSKIPKV